MSATPDPSPLRSRTTGTGEFWYVSEEVAEAFTEWCTAEGIEARDDQEYRWLRSAFTAGMNEVARYRPEREAFEFPRDGLDLESAFAPGAYVRYQHPDEGWEADQIAGRKLLTHGRLYRVAWNDIGQSKTRIGLVGAEGSFNSVLFEPVASGDVTDAEAAEVARRNGIKTATQQED